MNRRAFTLIEVLMAMTILGAAAAVMVAPLYQYARRSRVVSLAQARNGIVAQQVGRLTVLPFDSLESRAGCVTTDAPPLEHTRCIRVTTISPAHKLVTLVVTPTDPQLRPDTSIMDRARPVGSNPFST